MNHVKMLALEEENVIKENAIVMKDLLVKTVDLSFVQEIALEMEIVIKEFASVIKALKVNFVKKLK